MAEFQRMEKSGLIVSDPKVMIGKPVLRGTRITVDLILEKFAAGHSEEDILRAHPHITREGIRAALAFAAEALQASVLYPLERMASGSWLQTRAWKDPRCSRIAWYG